MDYAKENARIEAGDELSKLAGAEKSKIKVLECNVRHLTAFCAEVKRAGLTLASTATATQCATLIKLLHHFGNRGIGTLEAHALGYARLSARIQDIEEHWVILAQRGDIDQAGFFHQGMARYFIVGARSEVIERQFSLELAHEVSA